MSASWWAEFTYVAIKVENKKLHKTSNPTLARNPIIGSYFHVHKCFFDFLLCPSLLSMFP